MIRPYHITIISLLILSYPLLGLSINQSFSYIDRNNAEKLFANIESPGNLAICRAEGNCDKNGQFTSLYYGHIDPSK
ncbi:MAG: hypothetical protein HC815_41575 [Richelia sp. RM1_1_1]|nr:hypothetical protein [Richelia sp. RM1_1_1]